MPSFRSSALLVALVLSAPVAADRGLSLSPSLADRSLGTRQNAAFARRMVRLSGTIDRLSAAGLPAGRAAFLRQDVARVADMVATALRTQGRLKPVEERGYAAMLDQIDRKLARAQAERRAAPLLVARR